MYLLVICKSMSIQAIVQVYDNCLIICHNIDNRNMNVKSKHPTPMTIQLHPSVYWGYRVFKKLDFSDF